MSDHTLIPPDHYPGGSETEFKKLKDEISRLKTELQIARNVLQQLHDSKSMNAWAHNLVAGALKTVKEKDHG